MPELIGSHADFRNDSAIDWLGLGFFFFYQFSFLQQPEWRDCTHLIFLVTNQTKLKQPKNSFPIALQLYAIVLFCC